MYEGQVPKRVSDAQEGRAAMRYAMAGAVSGVDTDFACAGRGAEVRQSEIESQVHRLLGAAETLDKCVAHLLGKIEKVTTQEQKADGGSEKLNRPVLGTSLGRDLDSINARIQNTINTLQSTTQRIEL